MYLSRQIFDLESPVSEPCDTSEVVTSTLCDIKVKTFQTGWEGIKECNLDSWVIV
jgi:hypothetical protein